MAKTKKASDTTNKEAPTDERVYMVMPATGERKSVVKTVTLKTDNAATLEDDGKKVIEHNDLTDEIIEVDETK